MGLIILFFVLYIAFGRYGNVTLERQLIDQNSITLVGRLCSSVQVLDRIFYIGVSLSGHSIIKYHRMVQRDVR